MIFNILPLMQQQHSFKIMTAPFAPAIKSTTFLLEKKFWCINLTATSTVHYLHHQSLVVGSPISCLDLGYLILISPLKSRVTVVEFCSIWPYRDQHL